VLCPLPQVLCGLDLSGCTAALIFDRASNAEAAVRQLRLDNRKPRARRALESPTRVAMLLLLRGVRCAALTPVATTTWANAQLAAGLLRGLASEGKTLGAAAAAALQGLGQHEVQAVREAGLVVWGLPFAAAPDAGDGGKKGGRGGAARK
jgi:hypothetical protein